MVLDDAFQSIEEVAEDDSLKMISKTPDSESSFINDQSYIGNKNINNFSAAKSIFKKSEYFGIKNELYCGCEFSGLKISKSASCGLKPRNKTNEARTYRIEFEHIVPFENQIGHTSTYQNCSKDKRSCASKAFSHLEGDLWNLWPAVGEMNGDRSNHPYVVFPGVRNQYGKCDFMYEKRGVEPRNEVKALIAYTYLYFQKAYAKVMNKNYITSENKKMFSEWIKYPVSKEQCNWAKEVLAVQKNRNEDLLKACKLN